MEFKSQVNTTWKQSERLIAIGLKTETADCGLFYILGVQDGCAPKGETLPAWSLHRLMEILHKGDIHGFVTIDVHNRNIESLYEIVIAKIEYLVKIKHFDVQYLEEQSV